MTFGFRLSLNAGMNISGIDSDIASRPPELISPFIASSLNNLFAIQNPNAFERDG